MYLNRRTLSLICFCALGFLETAQAQVYFEQTFFPVYVKKNDGASIGGGATTGSVPTESGLGYDLRTTLGYYSMEYGIFFGGTYNTYSVDTKRAKTTADGLKTSTEKTEYGLTLGYINGGFKLFYTHFLNAEKKASQHYLAVTPPDLDESFKNTKGEGFQVAIGYGLNLGAGFEIGPTLIYREVKYGKQSHTVASGTPTLPAYGTTKLQTKAVDSELKPMITISYRY